MTKPKANTKFTCLTCKKVFLAHKYRQRKYCSLQCKGIADRDESKYKINICLECGVSFRFNIAQIGERKYCSIKCAAKRRGVNSRLPGKICNCLSCHKVFITQPSYSRGKFCSKKCWGEWLSANKKKENNPNYKKKFGRPKYLPPPTEIQCIVCNKTMIVKPSHAKRRKCCSKQCQAIEFAQSGRFNGENNFNWRGGYDPYYGPSWSVARNATRERDKICQDCGVTPEILGRELDVHHIIPFRVFTIARHIEANDLQNLVALCPSCHLKRDWAYEKSLGRKRK